MLLFDSRAVPFRRELEEITRVKFESIISFSYPPEFLGLIEHLSTKAIPRTLELVSSDLAAISIRQRIPSTKRLKAAQRVKQDPSFSDKRGLVSFIRVGSKLEIGREPPQSCANEYHRQLMRAIARISDNQIMSRIHNRDPLLSRLFDEYKEELQGTAVSPSPVSLWMIGMDIDNRVRSARFPSADDEPPLDENTIQHLTTFLTAHNLYLQAFPRLSSYRKTWGDRVLSIRT
jgi:hypothetical protein